MTASLHVSGYQPSKTRTTRMQAVWGGVADNNTVYVFVGKSTGSPATFAALSSALQTPFLDALNGSFKESTDGSTYSGQMNCSIPGFPGLTVGDHLYACLFHSGLPAGDAVPDAVAGPFTLVK
jgi:hypothetical protein